MKNLKSLKDETARALKEVSIENTFLEARLLISHALNLDEVDYATLPNRPVSGEELEVLQKLLDLRRARMPLSQIFGDKEFWSLNFRVTKDTLTPRADSETLTLAALGEIKDPKAELRILDMGTGSGCLLLSLLSEWPNATGLGIDISDKALAIAKENAANLELSNRAEFRISNWTNELNEIEKFDLIICNPPYIGTDEKASLDPEVVDHEPEIALFSGREGLDDYKLIAPLLGRHLRKNGVIILEIGHLQGQKVKEIFILHGFNNITLKQDLGRRDRCLVIKL